MKNQFFRVAAGVLSLLAALGCLRQEPLGKQTKEKAAIQVIAEDRGLKPSIIEIARIWRKAGALTLWEGEGDFGREVSFKPNEIEEAIPYFSILSNHRDSLKKVPQPHFAYGLEINMPIPDYFAPIDLDGFKEVTSLRLEGVAINDDIFPILEKLPKLRNLTLAYTEITPKGLAAFQSLSALDCLVLGGSSIKDQHLDCVQKCIRLRSLRLFDVGISNDGLKCLEHLDKLESLSLASCKVSRPLRWLNPKAPLRSYLVEFMDLDEMDTALLSSRTRLKKLALAYTKSTDKIGEVISNLANLQALDVSGNAIGDKVVGDLKKLPALKALVLRNTKVTGAGISEMVAFPKLQKLYMDGTQLTDGVADEMAKLNEVQILTLDGCNITDSTGAKLAVLPKLQSLSLSGTKSGDATAVAISKNPEIKYN